MSYEIKRLDGIVEQFQVEGKMTEAEKKLLTLLERLNETIGEIKRLSIEHSVELSRSERESLLHLSGADWDNPQAVAGEAARWLKLEEYYGSDDQTD